MCVHTIAFQYQSFDHFYSAPMCEMRTMHEFREHVDVHGGTGPADQVSRDSSVKLPKWWTRYSTVRPQATSPFTSQAQAHSRKRLRIAKPSFALWPPGDLIRRKRRLPFLLSICRSLLTGALPVRTSSLIEKEHPSFGTDL
jgi:hypothetical protein